MRAFSLLRDKPWYRRDAFAAGLRAAGHDVRLGYPDRFDAETLLVIWNRYADNHEVALRVERGGGRVLVAENGYIAKGGGVPKFEVFSESGGAAGHFYALAEGWHNGFGTWPVGGPERWDALGVALRPLKVDQPEPPLPGWSSGHVLVCPNRSFGVPGRQFQAPDWGPKTVEAIRKLGLPAKLRPHPGNNRPMVPLEVDLAGARAVVVWASSAGVHALVAGIPVVSLAPRWICKSAALDRLEALLAPIVESIWDGYRRFALERLAWAQWTVEEIASGEPFRRLLS